jgi:multicomponent Na+:H+ antiporter subunit E
LFPAADFRFLSPAKTRSFRIRNPKIKKREVAVLAVVKKNASVQDKHWNQSENRPANKPAIKRFAVAPFILTFFIMGFFWVVFSGKFDRFHIILGIGSCLIVAALSADLLFPEKIKPDLILCWLRFVGYIPWLLYQIFRANLHVLYLTFHPRMMELIDPKIIEFNTKLKSEVSRTTFANSITLTPGTITVSVSVLGKLAVHCIDEQSGRDLPGEMELRIARVFEE